MNTVADARRIPLSRMRRGIVRAMEVSASVPQFTIEVEARTEELEAVRERVIAAGARLSFSDVLIAACATTLVAHPRVNASYTEDAIIEHQDVNVGIAIALDDGLIAPAISGAETLPLAAIEAERVRLTEAARAGSLSAEEILRTTFTISNLGPFGVSRFQALVVPPQAAILAVGAPGEDGRIALNLSCDHRVLDGAPAARFLGEVAERLQDRAWIESLL